MYYCGVKPRAMQTPGQESQPQKMETIVIHPNKPGSTATGDSALIAQLKEKPAITVRFEVSKF